MALGGEGEVVVEVSEALFACVSAREQGDMYGLDHQDQDQRQNPLSRAHYHIQTEHLARFQTTADTSPSYHPET